MKQKKRVRSGFLLAALGMIYGDIGTSPLYVLKYIVAESGESAVGEALILGALSLILWTLLLLATVKGVLLLLRADNQGEGGHFALFALVRDRGHWLLFPAALGGAALLADSVLTPALTLQPRWKAASPLFRPLLPAWAVAESCCLSFSCSLRCSCCRGSAVGGPAASSGRSC